MKNHRDTQTYFMRNRKTDKEYARAIQARLIDFSTTFMPVVQQFCRSPLGTFIYRQYATKLLLQDHTKLLTKEKSDWTLKEKSEQFKDTSGITNCYKTFDKTITKGCRAWQIKKRLKELSAEYQKRVRLELERDERERLEDEERKKKDLVSKVFPMRTGDFAMLYSMVDRWKKSEIERITSMSCGAAKVAEFYMLLEKEIEILQSIERLRNKVKKDLEVKKVMNFFKSIGSPIEWDSDYKNMHIVMDTLEAQKGREYYDLYQKLCNKHLSKEEKLEVYSSIKEYLHQHQCAESQEITSLIDRVCELIARGMSSNYLTGKPRTYYIKDLERSL